MKIGLLLIATGQYSQFVAPLVASARQQFMRGHDVQFFLFGDHKVQSPLIHNVHQPHAPWPASTLMRYEIFWRNRAHMAGMDYLYYLDVDAVFLAPVGEEILGETVAVLHPGFWSRPRGQFPYETRRESAAYIPPVAGSHYFAGGFQGGVRDTYLGICHQLSIRVETDRKHGLTAVHNDESHFNWYCACNQKPTVILDPSYCYPQGKWMIPLPFERRIVMLKKDHAAIRRT